MTVRTLAPFEAAILDELLDAQRRLQIESIGTPNRQQLGRRITATVTIAAALGGTIAVVVTADPFTSTPTRTDVGGDTATEPLRAQTVAFVTRRAGAALANLDDMVLHTRETRTRVIPTGTITEVYDTWSDRGDPEHSRSMYLEYGQPIYDIQTDSSAASELLVDYRTHTWYESPTTDFSNGHLLQSTPDRIRDQLDAGGVTLVGHETIGGRDTLHLSRHDIAPLTGDIWVDATSYLVVRSSNATGTTDFEWLARDAASRSTLVPVTPPGFAFGGRPPETPARPDGTAG